MTNIANWDTSRIIEENTNLKIRYDSLDELYKGLVQQMMSLETENQMLWTRHNEDHEQISKAIEYLKEKAKNNCMIDIYQMNDLIKILRGDENE